MSSEKLGHHNNVLKGDLGGGFDILTGSTGEQTDLGISKRFGGAAAAYSLRDIGAMNGSVVRVRREPHDTDATINDEENFSANQVKSGALEDWVNGKLESTLPADVATAAAAYSLRKVKASYSGNAVRIRRSSDSIEVDVAFDSVDKVSASSAITDVAEQGGESGQTTATDLNEFLNPTYTVGTSLNSSLRPFDSFTSNGNDGFTATNDATGAATAGFPYTFATGDVISVSFDLVIENSASPTFILSGNNMGSGSLGTGTTFTTSGSYTQEITTTSGTGTHLAFTDGNTGTFTVSNFRVTSHKAEAFVHTWYDQVGSKNATKITAFNQPKIAESGALLTGGIKFNGSSTSLSTGSQVLTANETGSQSLYAVCNVTDGTSGYIAGSADDDSSGKIGQSIYYYTTTDVFALSNGSTATNTTVDTISAIRGKDILVSFNYSNNDANTLKQNANQKGYSDGSDAYDFEAGSNFIIGARGGTVQVGRALDGSIQEVIAYDSNQSDNRFKIESNINNYYGLYNDEYEWDDATNTEWQNDVTNGTTTFTANGKDGFTITATGENISNFKYAITSPSAASNNYYKVSFNVDDPDGLFDDAQLRLTATGSGATAQTITNGFNSMSLRTGASFEYMSINSDGGGSSKTATLSDFKISLIARDGLVETLYDQSDNGNDASQSTAGSQPAIVKNGGLIKLENEPSIKFDGTNDFLERSTFTQGDLNQTNTAFAVAKLRVFVDDNQKIFDGHNSLKRNMIQLNQAGSGEFAAFAGSLQTTGENADADRHLFESRFNGVTSRLIIDGVIKNTNNQGDQSMEGINIGANHDSASNFWDGDIQEIIIYNSDLFSDRADLENDINNHYTIY